MNGQCADCPWPHTGIRTLAVNLAWLQLRIRIVRLQKKRAAFRENNPSTVRPHLRNLRVHLDQYEKSVAPQSADGVLPFSTIADRN